jgi:sec-independent protein translocase protein TatA
VFDGLIQPTHLIFVLAIALIVFGPKRLPELGRSLGGGIRAFKESVTGGDGDEPPAPKVGSGDA